MNMKDYRTFKSVEITKPDTINEKARIYIHDDFRIETILTCELGSIFQESTFEIESYKSRKGIEKPLLFMRFITDDRFRRKFTLLHLIDVSLQVECDIRLMMKSDIRDSHRVDYNAIIVTGAVIRTDGALALRYAIKSTNDERIDDANWRQFNGFPQKISKADSLISKEHGADFETGNYIPCEIYW